MPEPDLTWHGDVPVASRFADAYFSRTDGLGESRHVFVRASRLPERFRPGFHIAEIGFGTGLNMLAAYHAWRASGSGGRLRYTGFEAFPLDAPQMARAWSAWPDLARGAGWLLQAWKAGKRRLVRDDLDWQVIEGDARSAVPRWAGRADAWFLDGFAPARNPELWEPALLAAVVERTAPGGSLVTYSAAGHVRRALAAAGCTVERLPGFGPKRHMTRAWRA
jgi:tRNA U34 5-methylaminomethyl-2-thiouridine-forming methyltransferase MnmC